MSKNSNKLDHIISLALCEGDKREYTSFMDIDDSDVVIPAGEIKKLKNESEGLSSGREEFLERRRALEAENAVLKAKIAEMEEEARSADSLKRENERLKELNKLTETRQDFQMMDSYVISYSAVDWSSTLTIDRGSVDGVEEGMCAITANGAVVGLITEVGTNYSVVKTVLDSSLEISGTIASSGYNGIVTGAYITGQEGLLRMDYLASSAIIRNRDQVVTSGSTVYPRDLMMGYVVDAGFDETGVAKYALLEPAVEVGGLEQVFILMAFDEDK